MWREVNGDFTALDNTPDIKAWSIATGKLTKANVTLGNIDVKGYSLYQSQQSDHTYKMNWC